MEGKQCRRDICVSIYLSGNPNSENDVFLLTRLTLYNNEVEKSKSSDDLESFPSEELRSDKKLIFQRSVLNEVALSNKDHFEEIKALDDKHKFFGGSQGLEIKSIFSERLKGQFQTV